MYATETNVHTQMNLGRKKQFMHARMGEETEDEQIILGEQQLDSSSSKIMNWTKTERFYPFYKIYLIF